MDEQAVNATTTLDAMLNEHVQRIHEAAVALIEAPDQKAEARRRETLDGVLRTAVAAAELHGADELLERLRDIGNSLTAGEAATEIVARVEALQTPGEGDAGGQASDAPMETAQLPSPHPDAAPADDVAIAPTETDATAAVVALTDGEYDIVHDDEDVDLREFFLDAVRTWSRVMQDNLPALDRTQCAHAYGEALEMLHTSANYVDVPWVVDLMLEQRGSLQWAQSAGPEDRVEALAGLAQGVARLSLLGVDRDTALAGIPVPAVLSKPDAVAGEPAVEFVDDTPFHDLVAAARRLLDSTEEMRDLSELISPDAAAVLQESIERAERDLDVARDAIAECRRSLDETL